MKKRKVIATLALGCAAIAPSISFADPGGYYIVVTDSNAGTVNTYSCSTVPANSEDPDSRMYSGCSLVDSQPAPNNVRGDG